MAILAVPLLGAEDKVNTLGRTLAGEMERNTVSLDSPAVSLYANRIGQRLATPGTPYRFTVVKDDLSELGQQPLVLPGSYVFIPVRAILNASSESEFATALAYSMISRQHGPVFIFNSLKNTPPDPKILQAAQALVRAAGIDESQNTEFLRIQSEIRNRLPKPRPPTLYQR